MWRGVSCPQSQGRGRPGLGSPDLHLGWGSGQCGVPQVWPEPVRLVSWMRCMPSTCFSTWAGRASRDPDACLRFRSAVSLPRWRLLSARRRAGWRPRFVFPGRPGLRGPRAGLPASAAPAGTFHFRASIRSLAAHAVAASRARRFTTKRVSGSVSPRRVPGILGNLHLLNIM